MNSKNASALWDRGRTAIFDFAAEIADGSNIDIAKLAYEKDRTPSLFYGYQKGGELWNAMLQKYPGEAETLRDSLEIGYWVALARRWKSGQISFKDTRVALIWLAEHRKSDNISVEKFREKLQSEFGGVGDEADWNRKSKWIEKNFIHYPALGTSQAHVHKIRRAALLLQGRVLAASKEAENQVEAK